MVREQWGIYELCITPVIAKQEDRANLKKYFQNQYLNDCFIHHRTAVFGIQLIRGHELVSHILVGDGKALGQLNKSQFLCTNDSFLFICGASFFSFGLPCFSLKLNQTFFKEYGIGIYPIQSDFILRGKHEVIRIDKEGNIIWKYDIPKGEFCEKETEESFKISDDKIHIKDKGNKQYVINQDGSLEEKAFSDFLKSFNPFS